MDTSKIIKGVVNSGRYTVTAPIVKEDYGLYLQIEGVELPSTYEVDFSNSEHNGTSVTMIGNSDGVLIPHQFIDTGKDIFAFLYHVGANYGRTVYKFRIPNKVRPDRTEDTPTPEEQSVIDQAISALNEAVEQTSADVASADQSAQSASDDADRAEQAKADAVTMAQRSANSAQASADYSSSAQASATASAQSASQSAQIKADVEDLADDAQGYAQASAQSASQASASEQGCARAVLDAASAAAIARARAEEASGYAQTASTKASEASQSAQTASNKASEASQSVSQALTYKNDAESAKTASQTAQGLAEGARDTAVSAKDDAESARDDAVQAKEDAESAVASISGALDDKAPVITDTASGSIASFTDGADNLPLKSLIVDINPVQDLHGQDSPYPAGGGKNLFDANTVVQGYYVSDDNGELNEGNASYVSDYIEVDAGQTYRISPTLSSGNWGAWYDENKAFISGFSGYSTAKTAPSNAKYLRFTVSRNGSNPNYATTTQVEKGSTPTSWSPYENICPISGWTEVDVEQSGVNLANAKYGNKVPSVVSGQMVNASGWSTDYIKVDNSKTYSVSIGNASTSYIFYYDDTFEYLGNRQFNVYARVDTESYFNNATYIKLRNDAAENNNPQIQLELGTTPSPYHPYTGRSITIDLGQTVYGGKLDVLSGVLTIDMAMVDLGTLSWLYSGESLNHRFSAIMPSDYLVPSSASDRANVVCSRYASNPSVVASTSALGISGYQGSTTIFVRDLAYSDNNSFKSAVNGEQLVYRLATPLTIQLTPNQVNSLLGVNNIWADTGDTEVEYRADTKLYISRLTEPDADMIADANIVSGQYFMVGNNLFKATANIANGGQITVGTNCTRVSLAQALNEINA